jgi:hypothetical protein
VGCLRAPAPLSLLLLQYANRTSTSLPFTPTHFSHSIEDIFSLDTILSTPIYSRQQVLARCSNLFSVHEEIYTILKMGVEAESLQAR